jgi:hypothetical protein
MKKLTRAALVVLGLSVVMIAVIEKDILKYVISAIITTIYLTVLVQDND